MSAILDTQDRTEAPAAEQAPGWAPLVVVLVGTFVTFLDFFIVNVALPSMALRLHAGPAAISLVVAGYGITFAAGMITGGRLGDLYGRSRMFAVGLALFTLASLACGLAPSVEVLIGARVAQGIAGALLTPQVLAIISTVYDGDRRQRGFAAYGLAMGIAGVLGQLIGGVLIHADVAGLGWRAIFLINVPVGLVVVPLVRRILPESYGARTGLDLVGSTTAVATLVALVVPLVLGREHGWPLWTWVSFALVPLLGGLFLRSQARVAAPTVDLSLFASRGFSAGAAAGSVFALVPSSFFFVLALYLQSTRHLGALFSGVLFAALGAGYFVSITVAGTIAARLGRQALAVGSAIVAAGFVALAVSLQASSSPALLPGLVLVGFGIGTVLVPLAGLVLDGVDPMQIGAASGVLASAQQVGGAVGVAVISSVYFSVAHGTEAFLVSLVVGIGLTLATATAAQLLPRRTARR